MKIKLSAFFLIFFLVAPVTVWANAPSDGGLPPQDLNPSGFNGLQKGPSAKDIEKDPGPNTEQNRCEIEGGQIPGPEVVMNGSEAGPKVASCNQKKERTVSACNPAGLQAASQGGGGSSVNGTSDDANALNGDASAKYDHFADECQDAAEECIESCKVALARVNAVGEDSATEFASQFGACGNKQESSRKFLAKLQASSSYKKLKQNYEYCNSDDLDRRIQDARRGAAETKKVAREADETKKNSASTAKDDKKNEQAKNTASDKCATNGASGGGQATSGTSSGSSADSSGCGGGGGGGAPGGGAGGGSPSDTAGQTPPTTDTGSAAEAAGFSTQEDKAIAAHGDTVINPESAEGSTNSAGGPSGGSDYPAYQGSRGPASVVGGAMGGSSGVGADAGFGNSSAADGQSDSDVGYRSGTHADSGGGGGGGGGGGWGGFKTSSTSGGSDAGVKALRKYLPGQELDPAKAAGLVGEDGVTGPNQFNWDKMHKQFQRQANGPIGFLP